METPINPIETAVLRLLDALKQSDSGRTLLRRGGLVLREHVQPIYQAALEVRNRYHGFRAMAATGEVDPRPLTEAVDALSRLIDQYEEKRHEATYRSGTTGRTEQARPRAQSTSRRRG